MSPLEATIDPVWLIIVKVVILFVRWRVDSSPLTGLGG